MLLSVLWLLASVCFAVISTSRGLTRVDTYTINAISQDEFDDVIVPDEPVRRPTQQLSGGTTVAVQQAVDARK